MNRNIEALLENIREYEDLIGYTFNNKDNILLALTHSSFANEIKQEKIKSNERVEFLGDAVLNIVISEKIYLNYPSLSEGEMTRARANIVCESSLMMCANKINTGKYLLLGKGEELTGGRLRVSILSDAFEALIGSIYIDGGMESAKSFILKQMQQIIEDSVKGIIHLDYKTELQEIVQRHSEKRIIYETLEEKGPDHNKVFLVHVKVADVVMGVGEGRSKKEAEQNAAKSALKKGS